MLLLNGDSKRYPKKNNQVSLIQTFVFITLMKQSITRINVSFSCSKWNLGFGSDWLIQHSNRLFGQLYLPLARLSREIPRNKSHASTFTEIIHAKPNTIRISQSVLLVQERCQPLKHWGRCCRFWSRTCSPPTPSSTSRAWAASGRRRALSSLV